MKLTFQKSHSLAATAALLALSSLWIEGCSLKPADRADTRIRLSLAPLRSALKSARTPTASGQARTLTALGTFSCIGLNITGAGIAPRSAVQSCASGMPQIGIVAGLVPLSQDVIEVSIPSGAARTIQVFGVVSSDDICPELPADLTQTALLTALESPIELGTATIDAFVDSEVNIHLTDPDFLSRKKIFCLNDSPTGKWDQAHFGQSIWGN